MLLLLFVAIGWATTKVIDDPVNHEIVLNLREGQKNAYLHRGYVSVAAVDKGSLLVLQIYSGRASGVSNLPAVRVDLRSDPLHGEHIHRPAHNHVVEVISKLLLAFTT